MADNEKPEAKPENPYATRAMPPGNTPRPWHVLLLDAQGNPTRAIELTEAGVTIGRLSANTLILDAPVVSRNHLRIDRAGDAITVTDLGSKSGTQLDKTRLTPQTPQAWQPGQTLQVGPFTLRLHAGSPPPLVGGAPAAPAVAAGAPPIIAPTARLAPDAAKPAAPPPASPAPPAAGATMRVAEDAAPKLNVTLPAGQTALTLTPGEPADVEVRITNRTPTPLTIALTLAGLPPEWVEPAPTLRVAQFASGVAVLRVMAPATPESIAGPYEVLLRAQPQEVPALAAEQSLEWRVAPFLAGDLQLAPRRARGREQAVMTVQLQNNGNARAVYQLRATDRRQELSLTLAEERVTIDPGDTAEVPLMIGATRRAFGSDRSLGLTVEADETSEIDSSVARTISDEARFVHTALLPIWSPLLLLLLLLLLYGLNIPPVLWANVPGRGFIAGGQVSGVAVEATRIAERATEQAAQGRTAIAEAGAALAATQSAVAALPTEQQVAAQTALADAFNATSTAIAIAQTAAAVDLQQTEQANNAQLAQTLTVEAQLTETAAALIPTPAGATATFRPTSTATPRPGATSTPRPTSTTAATAAPTLIPTAAVVVSAEADPTSVAFGSIKKGTTSAVRTVLVKNTSTTAITINEVAIGGANAGDFARAAGGTDNCGTTLAANTTCTITLTFTPALAGTRIGQLRIENTSATGTLLVSLSGSGTEIPEVASIVRVGSSPTNANSIQFQVNFSEAVQGVTTGNFALTTLGGAVGASIASVSPASSTSTNQWTVTVTTGGGNKTLRLDFINSSGVTNTDGNSVEKLPFNSGDPFVIDKAAPTVSLGTTPPNLTNNPSAQFTFSGNDDVSGSAVTFQCRVLPAAFATCATPFTPSGLTDGARTFEVRSVDEAGNTSSPASHTWTLDTTPPNTTISSAAPTGTTGSTVNGVTFTSSEAGSTFECRVLPAAFAACTTPLNLTGLADGSRTFEVRARDAAGNADTTPATRTWTVDATPPDTTIATGPAANSTTGTSVTFTFTSEPGATFECRLDGAAFAACTSPRNLTGLADGSRTFEVRAIDAFGNTDATPASRTWIVDATPPNTTLSGGPTGTVNVDTANFTFTSEPGATFECRLDGGAFAACTSPRNLTGLSDGSHTFDVRAIDGVGNVDPTPATRTWTVDTTPPDTSITAGPANGSTSAASVSFSFSSEPGATFECSLDGGAFTACTSPRNLTGLSDGSHTFEVRARDAVGNTDATPAARTWTVDATPPNTTINSGPSNPSAANVTFTFSSNEAGSTFQCRVDAAPFATCTSPQNLTLAGGSRTFEVRAIDGVGNVDASPATQTWTVDATPPTTTIDSGPSGTVAVNTATFTFSSNETGTFECSLDGGAFTACTSPRNLSGLGDGPHTFAVRAIDGVGNVDATPASQSWTVDTTPPAAPTVTTPAAPVTLPNSTATFNVTGSAEANSLVQIWSDANDNGIIDGADAVVASQQLTGGATSFSISVNLSPNTAHNFVVTATDAATNRSAPANVPTITTAT